MIPNEALVLEITQDHLDDGKRSCFTCLRWQLRERGDVIVCTAKPLTSVSTHELTREDGALTVRRAARCKSYDPEDDE
jgi:hypothetical protein